MSVWIDAISERLLCAWALGSAPAAVMLRQPGESFVWSVSHERLYASGGARMFWARGSIWMMIMGAPQCWQRKVGAVARRSLCGEWGSS